METKPKKKYKPAPLPPGTARVMVHIPFEYSEKLYNYCFWDGALRRDAILTALIEFLDSKGEIQPRPEKVRNKKKPGKKSIAA